jgi:hypothetical protein
VLNLDSFHGVRKAGSGWTARCPAHDDHRNSLSIGTGDDGRVLLKCHVGCSFDDIVAAAHLDYADLFPENTMSSKNGSRIVAEYDYRDVDGKLLYQSVRKEPKEFFARRPDGSGRWVPNLDDTPRVLYALPRLQRQKTILVPEGEKDADRMLALGLPATTNIGGAGKWRPEYTKQLLSAGVENVAVVPDNDEPGRKHAADIATSCHSAGLNVKVVTLPDLPPKGDVSNWLDAGHTKDELLALMQATPLYVPSDTSGQSQETHEPPHASDAASAPSAEAPGAPTAEIDLASLLDETRTYLRRYVVLTNNQAIELALWVAHTHAFKACECTPYQQVTSATARAGKSRLLEALEQVVARAWYTCRTTSSALVRKIDAEGSTLLLDESDTAFSAEKEYAEGLRGILNSGYRKGGAYTVCVGQGTKITARDFSTFGAKAIAGIGKLPDTVADRSVRIELRRRTRAEPCEKWRHRDGRAHARPIRERLAIWAAQAIPVLRDARPDMPSSLGDRQQDVWEPLIAIADLAGGDWPSRARAAAVELSGSLEDADIKVELLHDIEPILAELPPTKDTIASAVLVEKLIANEDRPWATWRHGEKPITQRGLANLLKPFGIVVGQYNVNGKSERGYRRDAFDDAFSRFPPPQAGLRDQPNNDGPESQKTSGIGQSDDPACKTQKEPENIGDIPPSHLETRVSESGEDDGLF